MNTSRTSPLLRTVCRIAAIGLIVGVTGCADMVSNGKASRREGIKQFEEGNYTDAAGSFRNAARQNPRDYQSFYYLGQSYEQLGQFHQAIQAYKAALDTQRTTLQGQEDYAFKLRILDGLASAIAKGDERDQELNVIEETARKEQKADQNLLLAKIYRNRGDVDGAIDAYNRAVLLEPENFHINKEYGLYLEQIGQQNRALVPLKRAYALNGSDAEVNEALRRMGIVPGPSLKDERDLAQPPIPKGPIPEWQPQSARRGNANTAPTPTLSPSADAPRD